MVAPVLKWAGGKRQLLDDLKGRFPVDGYKNYHEPMFGGGALFFSLEPEDGSINDTNPRLVNFYKQIRDKPREVIDLLENFQDPDSDPDPSKEFSESLRDGRPTKNYYYQQRALFNRRPNEEDFDEVEEAAQLLYLNRTCFNGLYRENSDGEFNVPIGSYANPDWIRATEIRAASTVLENTEIFNADLEYIVNENVADSGDLVYFDPPYEPMSPTASFNDYSEEGFGREDQERLLDVASELSERDVYVILSNSGVMYDRYTEAGFYVDIEGATRSINSDADNRGEVDEIIATNIPPENQTQQGQQELVDYR